MTYYDLSLLRPKVVISFCNIHSWMWILPSFFLRSYISQDMCQRTFLSVIMPHQHPCYHSIYMPRWDEMRWLCDAIWEPLWMTLQWLSRCAELWYLGTSLIILWFHTAKYRQFHRQSYHLWYETPSVRTPTGTCRVSHISVSSDLPTART